jgi:hypothetical protein
MTVPEDFLIILSSVILAAGTIALVVVTGYYAKETKRLRRIAELPSFALRPSAVTLSGDLFNMYLVNTGQTATDIRIDCTWSGETKKIYIVSLSTNGYAYLPHVPVGPIASKGDKLTLDITCKDSGGNEYAVPKIEVDFDKIKKKEEKWLTSTFLKRLSK